MEEKRLCRRIRHGADPSKQDKQGSVLGRSRRYGGQEGTNMKVCPKNEDTEQNSENTGRKISVKSRLRKQGEKDETSRHDHLE
ncbi:UNVERIFIED_CONTAM: hypothetical protein HHA_452670 [Hammondia hammondi]|eukprot:XP_008885846.1 hypothetical protein HHA_452670 [Hammondia hammondi]